MMVIGFWKTVVNLPKSEQTSVTNPVTVLLSPASWLIVN